MVNLTGYSLYINTSEGTCSGCTAFPNGTTLVPITSNPFNITLNGFTNPQDAVDSIIQCQIVSPIYLAYSNQVVVQPTPTAIQFSSQLALSTLVVNRLANLTMSLSSIAGTEANISLPGQLMSRLNACYFGGLRLSVCTATYQDSTNSYVINAKNVTLLNTTSNSLLLELQLYPAVQSINSIVNISVKAPYSVSTSQINVTLIADSLGLSVSTSSQRINALSNVTVSVGLLSVAGTYTDVNLPFIYSSITASGCTFSKLNSTAVRIIAFTSPNLTLVFSNITNPYDNRPMIVTANQISNSTGTMVALSSASYQMTQLGTIIVQSAVRNSSNLNAPIAINILLSFDTNGSMLSVRLLQSQVYYISNLSCQVGGINQTCVNLNNQVNITSQWAGTRNLTLVGFSNSKSSQKLASTDTMLFQLYNPEGYQVAVNTLQSYLIP
jgi:hypothetical protein